MRYAGPNAELVQEVIDFLHSGRVLAAVGPAEERLGLRIVTDLQEALAFHQRHIFEAESAAGGGEALTWFWGDLLEGCVAEFIYTADWYEWEAAHAAELAALRQPFDGCYADEVIQAPEIAESNYADEVIGSLRNVAESRAFNGRSDNFWERLFAVYREGLWPCGWEGRWPGPGRFVAWRRGSRAEPALHPTA